MSNNKKNLTNLCHQSLCKYVVFLVLKCCNRKSNTVELIKANYMITEMQNKQAVSESYINNMIGSNMMKRRSGINRIQLRLIITTNLNFSKYLQLAQPLASTVVAYTGTLFESDTCVPNCQSNNFEYL